MSINIAALAACMLFAAGARTDALAAPAGNATRGAEIYTRCEACHALEYSRTGPKHCGVIGRKSGSVPGFDYSPAMKRAKLTWDEKTLDRFLADPLRLVPGTTMTYAGIPDPQERADIIAYLRDAGKSPACR